MAALGGEVFCNCPCGHYSGVVLMIGTQPISGGPDQSVILPPPPNAPIAQENESLATMANFWLLQLGGWGLLSTLLLTAYELKLVPLKSAADRYMLVYVPCVGLLVTSLGRRFCRRIFERRYPVKRLIFILLLLALGLSIVTTLASQAGFYLLGFRAKMAEYRQIFGLVWLARYLVLATWVSLYFIIKESRNTRQLELQSKDSAIMLLRAQINPHFLFNALNSILAQVDEPQKVSSAIQSLSNYLRFSINQNHNLHTLGEELEAMENYLAVEKMRYDDRFNYRIEAEAVTRTCQTPPWLIQPLVENAIKYGTMTRTQPLELGIFIRLQGDDLSVVVENSGPWVPHNPNTSLGTGLANLRQRLAAVYGSRIELTVDATESKVRVSLRLPGKARKKTPE